MKKNLLFLLFLSLTSLAFSKEKSIGSMDIISEEVKHTNGIFECKVRITPKESFTFTGLPVFQLPNGWKAMLAPHINLHGRHCRKGEHLTFTLIVTYPHSNLPFFPQSISISIPAVAKADTSFKQIFQADGKVYFTPYNTIEIFSEADFENSQRVWLNDDGVSAKRIFIPKSRIPVSDLNMATDTIGGKDMEDIPVQLVYIQGLAYCVPMKIKSDSILVEQFDDGADSLSDPALMDELTELLVKVSNGEPVDSTMFMPTATQKTLAKTAFKFHLPRIHIHINIHLPPIPILTRRFTGTVTGQLTSTITNDLGKTVNIPLSGVFVSLKERDAAVDELFGYVHTNEQGYYTISYDVNQSLLEGKEIELYVEIKSKNENYDIKTKQHSILGAAYAEVANIGSVGTNGGTITKGINTSTAAFRVTNWATRCWLYSVNNGFNLAHDLTILPHQNNSLFVEDGDLGVSLPLLNPTIKLESSDCNQENTIYHEFGHFMMWNVQGFRFTPVFTDPTQDGHSWPMENTSRIAWAEGWADAHGMIMDAVYWWEDNEYGCDDPSGYNYKNYGPLFEKRIKWQKNLGSFINNGIWSEYFIACAIYDLWDGAGKGVPLTIPLTTTYIGYNDRQTGGWSTDDDVELSFGQIVNPLLLYLAQGQPIANINEYFSTLQLFTPDCNLKSKISRCFAENRVVFDITKYEQSKGYGEMASGAIGMSKTVFISGKLGPLFSVYTDTYRLTYFQDIANQTIDYSPLSSPTTSITDYIVLGEVPDRITNLNIKTPTLTFYTCGLSGIEVQNGTFTLGDGSHTPNLEVHDLGIVRVDKSGTMTINSGSELVVKSGGTLFIRSGSTVNVTNGKIRVEAGGYICIESGAHLNFDPASELYVDAAANIGANPILNVGFTGCSNGIAICGMLTGGNSNLYLSNSEALLFDGVDDFVEIPETNGRLNLGTGDFTLEAFIKANSTNSIQVILSKRTFASGATADGFMFGIWNDGHLWAQLEGSPNLIDNSQNYLTDGNCHHVAMIRSGTLVNFYIDGNQVFGFNSGRDISSTGSLRIGHNHISNLPFNGYIGEVRIWNYARAVTDLQSSISTNLTPQANLVGYWDMKDKSNSQFITDLSTTVAGQQNNGILGSANSIDTNDPIFVSDCHLPCKVENNFKFAASQNSLSGSALSSVNIYPNPFTEQANISFNQMDGIVNVSVTNMEGDILYTKSNCSTDDILTIGQELSAGVYLIRISNNNTVQNLKLIKAR